MTQAVEYDKLMAEIKSLNEARDVQEAIIVVANEAIDVIERDIYKIFDILNEMGEEA